jgi:hypothetical protein
MLVSIQSNSLSQTENRLCPLPKLRFRFLCFLEGRIILNFRSSFLRGLQGKCVQQLEEFFSFVRKKLLPSLNMFDVRAKYIK